MRKEISGTTLAYFETGTEGVLWAIIDESVPQGSYEGLIILNNGDYLEIFNKNNEPLFKGIIDFDFKKNWTPYPLNPKYGQQAIGGYWVHGVQKDIDPDTWLSWFLGEIKAKASVNIP
jgi:hypothetical protein